MKACLKLIMSIHLINNICDMHPVRDFLFKCVFAPFRALHLIINFIIIFRKLHTIPVKYVLNHCEEKVFSFDSLMQRNSQSISINKAIYKMTSLNLYIV